MATPLKVEIVTPERVLLSTEAEEVSMRTDAGEIAFLARHEDFIGAADITVVRISGAVQGGDADARRDLAAAVHGGFVHVDQDANQVRILAGVAELGEEVDVARARRALAEAEAASAPGEGSPAAEAGATSGGARRGAALALLEAGSPAAAARRARVRLEAAGAREPAG